MGILEVLTVIFVVLKLLGVIAWSWLIVFSPLLVALALYVIFAMVYGIIFFIGYRKIKRDFDDDFFK